MVQVNRIAPQWKDVISSALRGGSKIIFCGIAYVILAASILYAGLAGHDLFYYLIGSAGSAGFPLPAVLLGTIMSTIMLAPCLYILAGSGRALAVLAGGGTVIGATIGLTSLILYYNSVDLAWFPSSVTFGAATFGYNLLLALGVYLKFKRFWPGGTLA